MLSIDPHPLLDVVAFSTTFPTSIGSAGANEAPTARLDVAVDAPLASSDAVRAAVRDLLRHSGYKPTGRGKPASEYLERAASDGALAKINPAVDTCNVVSLHSGLPVSVVDLDRTKGAVRIGVAPAGARYVFNASGQEIDIAGLVVLADEDGPCAGPVKDSHRTKTHPGTTRTLSILWGTRALPGRSAAAAAWYRALLASLGATTELIG